MTTPTHELTGQTLDGRYRLDALLGSGGFGATYRGTRLSDDAQVAVKVLRLREQQGWKGVELFEREAEVMRSLDHPTIPSYLDSFTEHVEVPPSGETNAPASDVRMALVQTLVTGRSLTQRFESGWRISEADAVHLYIQLLETLRYLHGFRPPIIHRDINPNNVMLRDDDDAPFVVDFGGVKNALDDPDIGGSTIIATPGFTPLEQFHGAATPASDLFSLAATVVYLLSGRRAHELPKRGIEVDLGPLKLTDPRLLRVLRDHLHPDVNQRAMSAAEAIAVLQGPRERPSRKVAMRGQPKREEDHLNAADDALKPPKSTAKADSDQQPRPWWIAGLSWCAVALWGFYFFVDDIPALMVLGWVCGVSSLTGWFLRADWVAPVGYFIAALGAGFLEAEAGVADGGITGCALAFAGAIVLSRKGVNRFIVGGALLLFSGWSFLCAGELSDPLTLQTAAAALGLAGAARMFIPTRRRS